MPELPEVETVKRGLAPVFENAIVTRLDQNREDLRFPFPEGFVQRLENRTVLSLSRRAKYLMADLDDNNVLVMHLGMSGSFRIETDESANAPGEFVHARSRNCAHDHVVFHLDHPEKGAARIIYNDPRRFGFMLLIERQDINTHPLFQTMGLEPLGNELDSAAISRLFSGKKTTLKAALLNQKLIAGLGNIYVCEALWRTGLHPERSAGSIAGLEGEATEITARLACNIRQTLEEAIAAGGSSLRDHAQADGKLGYFQHRFAVYDREGEACKKQGCPGQIKRIVQSNRSTFFCPTCQA